jgi:ribosome recycling factor
MTGNIHTLKEALAKVGEWLTKEYGSVHTGRASPSILDNIRVDSYGSLQPIGNIASVNVEDPKTLRIVPWDKGTIKAIEKAIGAANTGLSVASDDQGLRVIFPMLTTENRERTVKVLKEKLEDARISVRKERESAMKTWKDEAGSEDEAERGKVEIQKCVDEANQNLELIFQRKEKEVLG